MMFGSVVGHGVHLVATTVVGIIASNWQRCVRHGILVVSRADYTLRRAPGYHVRLIL